MEQTKENVMIDDFAASLKDAGKSDNTIRNYTADIRHIFRHTPTRGDGGLNLTQQAIEQYAHQSEKSGLSRHTINRRLNSLRAYFEHLRSQGVIDELPTKNVRQLSIARQSTTDWLERHQVRAIFDTIDARNAPVAYKMKTRAIVTVFVNCGLRVQELCDLKMTDVDWDKGVLRVVGKGDKYRIIPFNNGTRKALQRWMQYRDVDTPYVFHTERSDHMTPRAVQHMMARINDELNFRFKVHHLRHTALKRVADATGRIESVAEFAGHDNIETSRRYITPSIKEIGDAIKRTEYDF